MRILFVDDDDVTLFLYRRLVKNRIGLEVHFALNGKEAVEWINASGKNYDLVFLDLNMPVMNGIEFLQHIELTPPELRPKKIYMMLGTELPQSIAGNNVLTLVEKTLKKPLKDDVFSRIVSQVQDESAT